MATPAEKFYQQDDPTEPTEPTTTIPPPPRTIDPEPRPAQPGQTWVSRRVASNGIVCVSWQQVSVGKHRAGARCDVLVSDQTLQFWINNDLLKTVTRTSTGEVRKKNASTQTEA